MADDLNKRKDALQKEYNLTQTLLKATETGNRLSVEGLKTKNNLIDALMVQKTASLKLLDVDKAIGDLLLEQVVTGKDLNKELIKRLAGAKKVLEQNIEVAKVEDERATFSKKAQDDLYASLGTMGDMLKAGTNIGASMALLKGLTEQISAAFQNTLGLAYDLNKELGVGSAEAFALGMQNIGTGALFSKFKITELTKATKDMVTTFGTAAGITNDIRNNVVELTKLTGDGAGSAKLVQSFEMASGNAQDMTDSIKTMSKDAGVLSSVVFKDLVGQQRMLVGATEKEIKLLAKKTVELNKQGLTLSLAKGMAESMMDIEGTMKAQAKARVILQGQLSKEQIRGMQGMVAAGLEFQKTGKMDGILAQFKTLNLSAEAFNDMGPVGQEVFAKGIGLTADQLADVIQKQEQMAKLENAGSAGKALQFLIDGWAIIPGGIKKATTGLLAFGAQQMIISRMQTGEFGISKLFTGKGNVADKAKGALPKVDTSPATAGQGAGAGLKDLASGLKKMGTGRVFAGIAAVALAGPAFIIALPAIPFILFMGNSALTSLYLNFSKLARGLIKMATTFVGSGALTAFAVAGTLAIPSLIFLSIFGKVNLPTLLKNFTKLSSGLMLMAPTFTGSGALTVFAVAGTLAIPSLMFLLTFGRINLPALLKNFTKLAGGLMLMAPTFVGSGALTAFAVAGALAIPSLIFLAGVALLGEAAGLGLTGLAGGLSALGASVEFSGIGILLIGALALAMVPLGYSLELASTYLKVFGDIFLAVFKEIPPLITAVVSGFVTLMGAVTFDNVGAMALLGPALMGVAFGLAAIGTVGLPGLLALTGLGAVTVLLAPSLISIADSISGLFGGAEKSSSKDGDSDSKALLNELKGLRGDIQSQPILITIDGKVVSRISRMAAQQGSMRPPS